MTDPTAPPDGAPWLPGGFQAMPDGSVAPPAPEAQASDQGAAPGFPFLAQPPPLQAVGTGAYTVDLERAPAAIRELEEALEKLALIRDEAVRLGQVTPPGADSVSRDAASLLGAAAIRGPGSLLAALQAGVEQLQTLISRVQDDLERYGRVESHASSTMDSAGLS